MTSLKDRLQTDLTASMKSRDELRSATLRMALTAIRTEEVAGVLQLIGMPLWVIGAPIERAPRATSSRLAIPARTASSAARRPETIVSSSS